MSAGVSPGYSTLRRKGALKGAFTRKCRSTALPYEDALIRKFYPEEGRDMVGRLSRTRTWLIARAGQLGVKYLGEKRGPARTPGTEDPVAIARMDKFLMGRV